jgi:hypothetical protein
MMSGFLYRIVEVLSSPDTCKDVRYYCLSKWNMDLEQFVQAAVQRERRGGFTISDDNDSTQINHGSVFLIFESLRTSLLAITAGKTLNETRNDIADVTQRHQDSNLSLESHVCDRITDTSFEKIQWSDLCVILRSAKNFWRWYIQLYLPSRLQYPAEIQERISRQDVESPWRSKRLLELLLNLLEKLSVLSSSEKLNESEHLQQGPQYLSQLFFYVTFPLSPNDLNLMDTYHYLITECNLMYRFLNILTRRDSSMQLRLSIIRNIHNALASFPQQSMKAVTATSFEVTADSEKSILVK